MKTKMLILLTALFIVGTMPLSIAYAEHSTATKATEDHKEHHPENEPVKKDSNKMGMGENGGMMESMNMDNMMGMMHECMEMHKDGKMCDHQTMEKCQENMGKAECGKMMKQAKAKEKTKKQK